MKYKWLALAALSVLTVGSAALHGCSGCASQDTLSGVSSQTESYPIDTGDGLDKNIAMETEIQSLSNSGVTLHYPVLNKMDSRSKQESLNAILLKDAKACMENRVPNGSSGIIDVTEGYHTKEYLSFVSTGSFTNPSSTDPQMAFYVTNLDLQSGQRYITPVRENARMVAQAIHSGEGCSVLTPSDSLRQQQEAYLKAMSEEDLTALLSACDYTDTDSAPKCFSYPLSIDNYAVYLPAPSSLTGYIMVQVRIPHPYDQFLQQILSTLQLSAG